MNGDTPRLLEPGEIEITGTMAAADVRKLGKMFRGSELCEFRVVGYVTEFGFGNSPKVVIKASGQPIKVRKL